MQTAIPWAVTAPLLVTLFKPGRRVCCWQTVYLVLPSMFFIITHILHFVTFPAQTSSVQASAAHRPTITAFSMCPEGINPFQYAVISNKFNDWPSYREL